MKLSLDLDAGILLIYFYLFEFTCLYCYLKLVNDLIMSYITEEKSKRDGMQRKREGKVKAGSLRTIRSVNGQSVEQRARPVGQAPAGIVGVPVPAGSLSFPSVEPRRVCSNLLETAAQPRPDLKGYGQLARHGQVCTRERKEGQEKATKKGGDE